MSQKHLLLVDGTNILRRCYEANPTDDSTAKADGAIKSAIGSIKRGIARHQPTHVFIAFDVPAGKTWRHETYAEYKATRKPTPAPLAERIPDMIERTREEGFCVMQADGYEAEDLMAAVGRAWVAKTTAPVTALSTDKDLNLLIAEGILIHPHFTDVWHDVVWVKEEYGVEAADLLTYFSLVGDTVDNIPGVSGVGPVTAAKLVNEHHTLEAIYEALKAGNIKGKALAKNLEAFESNAYISRELLAFKTPDLNMTFGQLKLV